MVNIFNLYNDWCELNGSCQPLHSINNVRFDYIKSFAAVKGKKILDLGCGGGLLSLKLALQGAYVTGVDNSNLLINIANINAKKYSKNLSGRLTYVNSNICTFKTYIKYDVILCMEVLEHVDNIDNFLNILRFYLKLSNCLIISSLDKNISSYLNIIFFAEYILKKLKKNTHNYEKFLSIKTLHDKMFLKNFLLEDIKFISYNPLLDFAYISNFVTPNYIIKLKSW